MGSADSLEEFGGGQLVLRCSFKHVHVTMRIHFILDLSGGVSARGEMSICGFLAVDHARVVAGILVGGLNELLWLVMFMRVVLVQKSLSNNFKVIFGMVLWTIGLSIANIMLWLFNSVA